MRLNGARGWSRRRAVTDESARAVLDAWIAGIVVLDPHGRIVFANAAWGRDGAFRGPAVEQGTDHLAACDAAAMSEPLAADVAAGVRSVLVGAMPEFRRTYAGDVSAGRRWFELRAHPFPMDGAFGVCVVNEDITDRTRQAEEGLARSLLIDEVDAAVIATDGSGVITSWSRGAERLYGWQAGEAVGRHRDDVVGAPSDGGGVRRAPRGASQEAWEGDVHAVRRDGSTVAVHLRDVVLRGSTGLPSGMVSIAVDRTVQRALEHQLRAITDNVADGLATLDGAGRITYVNPQGRWMMRASLTESRGGSFRDWIHGLDEAPPSAPTITETGSQPVECRLVRRDGSEIPIELTARALRTETSAPVTSWVMVFRDISAAHSREDAVALDVEEVEWLGRIREALADDGFVLYAQPIVDLATKRTVRHELLLRMRDPDDPDTLLAPGTFLPAAENLGVAPSIDRWVVARAAEFAARGHPVAVNVSAQSLEDIDFPRVIEQLFIETGANPANVLFEITETALLKNDAVARYFADQVRALGSELALDDFGTGYGGFTYLKEFPLSHLKIDIDFVRDAVNSPASRHILAAVVSLAAAFDLRTVAEGVEDEPTLALMETLGVDLAQGYLLGRPAPAAGEFDAAKERDRR